MGSTYGSIRAFVTRIGGHIELQRIRRTYPHRLAILHVTATWPRVVQREAKRGEVTGRRIPQDVLAATFRGSPPRSPS